MIRTLCFLLLLTGYANAHTFTDEHLNQLLIQSKKYQSSGLIYIWSPRMNLSILGAQEILVVAKKLNLEVTLVLDPAAVDEEVMQVSYLQNSPKLQSLALYSMSMTIHFPSLVLYQNGKLFPISRPGYDEIERVEDYLLRRLR